MGQQNDSSKNKIKRKKSKQMKDKNNYREKLKNTYGLKKYRIQEVIKPGQVILIQVLKRKEVKKEPL